MITIEEFNSTINKFPLNHNLIKLIVEEYYLLYGFNYKDNILEINNMTNDELRDVFSTLIRIAMLTTDYSYKFHKIMYKYDNEDREKNYLLFDQKWKSKKYDCSIYYNILKFDIRNLIIKSQKDILVYQCMSWINDKYVHDFYAESDDNNYINFNDFITNGYLSNSNMFCNDYFVDEVMIATNELGKIFSNCFNCIIVTYTKKK